MLHHWNNVMNATSGQMLILSQDQEQGEAKVYVFRMVDNIGEIKI